MQKVESSVNVRPVGQASALNITLVFEPSNRFAETVPLDPFDNKSCCHWVAEKFCDPVV